MSLLFDENISRRVATALVHHFPNCEHTSRYPELKTDQQIFMFARATEFCIVTFDEDFSALQLIQGHPPKIIWLRFGNTLISHQSQITAFVANPEARILELY